jgi:peptidoglycan/LPS O-acetylase OafA/YrhL
MASARRDHGALAGRESGRLGQLDDLRAVAAGLVFLCHGGTAAVGLVGAQSRADLYVVGRVGVAVFFIISGYVIYRPFVADRPDLWRYAVRRVVRIVPLYWLVLLACMWLVPDAVTSISGTSALRFFAFGQIYSTHSFFKQGLGTAWTLCIEMTFYAAVPILAALMARLETHRRRLEPWIIVALAVGSVAVRLVSPHGVVGGTLLGYFGWFAPGMLLAIVPRERWARLSVPPVAAWALAGALYLLIAPHLSTNTYPTQGTMLQYLGFAAVAVLIAFPVFAAERGPSKLGHWLGDRSYGIYLWHFPILVALLVFAPTINPIVFIAAAISITLLFAHASYSYLERPLMTHAAALRTRRNHPNDTIPVASPA